MPYKPTRATKSRNILLQKVIVGKGKTSTYDLPPADHVYGQAVFRDPLDDFGEYFINYQLFRAVNQRKQKLSEG
jgi:hypothetical protein